MNGKAERFIQTALREWAYARTYQTSDQHAAELPVWLHRYNWHRPHGERPSCARCRNPIAVTNHPASDLRAALNSLPRTHTLRHRRTSVGGVFVRRPPQLAAPSSAADIPNKNVLTPVRLSSGASIVRP